MGKPKHVGCLVEGCEGKHKAFGYCNKHYLQVKKYGVTKDDQPITPAVVEDKPIEVVKVKPKVKRPCITPAQLAHSSPEAFWCWQKENPIGEARVEKSRLVVRK